MRNINVNRVRIKPIIANMRARSDFKYIDNIRDIIPVITEREFFKKLCNSGDMAFFGKFL